MKKLAVLIAFLFVSLSYSQITFTLNSNVCCGTTTTLTANTGTDVVLSYNWTSSPATLLFSSPNSSTTAVNLSSTGTFTVALNVTLASGSGSYSTVVTVALSPTIIVTQSSATICMASNYPQYTHPIFLTASGGSSSYTWSPAYLFSGWSPGNTSAGFIRPPVSTCYTVNGTVGSCTSSAVGCVTVIPQFSIAISPSSGTICANDSLQLGVSNISTLAVLPIQTYNWYDQIPLSIDNPYNSTVTIFPTVTCTYSVEIFDALACVSLPTLVNIIVASCTGIHSNSIDNQSVLVYPNPANELLNIDCGTLNDKNAKLKIINNLGQEVFQSRITNSQSKFNIEELSKGIYFVQIESETKIIVRSKFVKQ